ncbi:MAG TPA: hypothetical protein VLV83_26790, partial [Acidobacteriota bacterium]|nr:hypothetical protein [Acidobacteriota bacterium]
IYIKFGPPTGIEKMPEGGSYYRKAREGGGLTYTHPFEVWFYNHIEGVGDGIEIEFVDFSRTNEYRMARDANDKDALLYVPGAGLTDAEHFGTQTRFDRLRTRFMGDVDARGAPGAVGFYALRARDMPMQRLQTLYDLQRPAEIQFKDLEKLVRVRVSYADLPFNFRTDHVQISERAWLVPVTVFFKNRDLTFEAVDEGRTKRATVNLYGQVESLGGRIVYVFEEAVKQDVPADQLQQRLEETAVFQKRFPLEPGRYKLTIVAQDLKSSRLSTIEKAIVVEESDQERLSASSLMLTKEVQPLADDLTLSDPFVIGKYKVIPASDNQFSPGEQFVQAYFEVYNMTLDQTTLEPSPKVELALFGPEGQMFDFTPIDQEFEFVGDRLMVYKTLPFAGLEKGNYKVKFRVTDLISGQVIETEARFELTESSNIQARSANP